MKNHYDIRINSKQPSSSDISKYKNFDALLETYQATVKPQRQSQPRLVYIATAIAVAAAACMLVYFNFFGSAFQPSLTEQEYFAQQPFINPPFEKIQPVATVKKVNATQGGVYELPSGSRLIVPREAFMNDRGAQVEGEVDIHYRELRDYVDFFLAGIPMTYDSAGGKYHFESAGMIEIYAEQNGSRIDIAPGKVIEIELIATIYLPTGSERPVFKAYRLDQNGQNWVYQQPSTTELLLNDEQPTNNNPVNTLRAEYAGKIAAIEARLQEQLRQIETGSPRPVEPTRPQKKNGNNLTFELDLNQAGIIIEDDPNTPENENERMKAQYRDAIWQIVPGSDSDLAALEKTWETFKVRQLNDQVFEITFIKGSQSAKVTVNPVLIGKDYEQALKNYEAAYEAYLAQLSDWKKQIQPLEEALKKEAAAEKVALEKELLQQTKALGIDEVDIAKCRVVNRFQATSLGLWNCFRLVEPANDQLTGSFEDQFGHKYRQHTAFLVNKKQNTLYRFYATKNTPLRFDEASDNLIWIVSEDHKIAVIRPTDFKKVLETKDDKIILQLVNEEIRQEEDVRKILKF